MKKYWQYFKYVLVHKIAVYREARKLGVGIWQGLVHDMSKLSPSEFIAYARFFYETERTQKIQNDFSLAWASHIRKNPHHWQYWVTLNDIRSPRVLEMPEKYAREMVADWRGVAVALGRSPDTANEWYAENTSKILLHAKTKKFVEKLLDTARSTG